jgi:hypothetical protein
VLFLDVMALGAVPNARVIHERRVDLPERWVGLSDRRVGLSDRRVDLPERWVGLLDCRVDLPDRRQYVVGYLGRVRGSARLRVRQPAPVTVGGWHHVGFTWDGSSVVTLYADGDAVGSQGGYSSFSWTTTFP